MYSCPWNCSFGTSPLSQVAIEEIDESKRKNERKMNERHKKPVAAAIFFMHTHKNGEGKFIHFSGNCLSVKMNAIVSE
jgi:hypothetical protein